MTFHQLFEAQAERTPSALALLFEEVGLTYAQLNGQANRLARVLADAGAGPGAIAGVLAAGGPHALVAILAVLKTGAAYLPLDPEYPRDRLTFLLDDAAPVTIVGPALDLEQLGVEWPAVGLDDVATLSAAARHPATNLTDAERPRPLRVSDPAYLIYTSGSTGRPKGVLVSHRGIPQLASSQVARFAVTPRSRVLQFAPLSFDASVSEICMALSAGACLVMAPRRRLMPGRALAELADETGATHLTLPPSALAAMPAGSLASVRTLVVAGEPCPPALVAQWSAGRRLINAYGPTETTVCATMSGPLSGAVTPPLGTPVDGSRVYVLDDDRRECDPEEPGELYVSGPCVALGYLRRPELTAQRFVTSPFDGGPLYRTGDLAVRRRDGSLHYLGRRDQQVKIRGFRVEPGEVEQVLLGHRAVAQGGVIAVPGPAGELELAGFAALIPGAQEDAGSLRHYLATQLPRHLVPARVEVLPALPVTANGKVDRAALASRPASADSGEAACPRQERTAEEKELAALFADVLGRDRAGRHDSFFDLGGHSLSAVRLISKISQWFRVELELDELYEAPTIAALARLLAARGAGGPHPGVAGYQRSAAGTRHVVKLAGSGAGQVFCVHAVDGGVSRYLELARQLAPDVTVHGITAIDLDDPIPAPPAMPALAARYVDELRQVQPSGPYHLVGWSSGGQLAYEMAGQLAGRGERVGSVTALDALRPNLRRAWRRYDTVAAGQWTAAERDAQWRYFLTNLFPDFDTLAIADPRHEFWASFDQRDEDGRREAVLALARDTGTAGPRLTAGELGYVFDVVLALDCAAANYQPSRYDGPVDLYVTDVGSRRLDTVAYWEQLAAGAVTSRHVPGSHTAVVERPGVIAVAAGVLAHVRSAVTALAG
jgi:amino acid adenylation domain-containing protein